MYTFRLNDSDKHTNTSQTLVFFSLVPGLNKLPDHHNLPLFDDMLQFGTSHEYLYSYLGMFCVNQNDFY